MVPEKCNIPKHELVNFAEIYLNDIVDFFETEEGQREYQEWLHHKDGKKIDLTIKHKNNRGRKRNVMPQ